MQLGTSPGRILMTYRGKIRRGMVIPEGQLNLPDGTLVRVEPVEASPLMDLVQAVEAFPKDASWPADGAAQIDHYLYGTPKQDE